MTSERKHYVKAIELIVGDTINLGYANDVKVTKLSLVGGFGLQIDYETPATGLPRGRTIVSMVTDIILVGSESTVVVPVDAEEAKKRRQRIQAKYSD